jgi:hypothetical protein
MSENAAVNVSTFGDQINQSFKFQYAHVLVDLVESGILTIATKPVRFSATSRSLPYPATSLGQR